LAASFRLNLRLSTSGTLPRIRSTRHPLYNRPLVNRNPAQTNMNYAPGHDAWAWATAHGE